MGDESGVLKGVDGLETPVGPLLSSLILVNALGVSSDVCVMCVCVSGIELPGRLQK